MCACVLCNVYVCVCVCVCCIWCDISETPLCVGVCCVLEKERERERGIQREREREGDTERKREVSGEKRIFAFLITILEGHLACAILTC